MSDIGIKGIGNIPHNISGSKEVAKNDDAKTSFADTLKNSIEKVDKLQAEADQSVQELLTGNEQNLHQVMIAVEKANLSFQLMMQVRNKIIGAYEEMMRTQV